VLLALKPLGSGSCLREQVSFIDHAARRGRSAQMLCYQNGR
jgi:hypothetical protein